MFLPDEPVLVELATPIPPGVVVHDWWIALCAAAAGEIHYQPQPTILYRQHGANHIGAGGFWRSVNPLRKNWRLTSPEASREFRQTIDQARLLRHRLAERSPPGSEQAFQLVDRYCRLFDTRSSRLSRVRELLRCGVRRQDPLRHMLLLARMLLSDPSATSQ